jgi:hypothetical protein
MIIQLDPRKRSLRALCTVKLWSLWVHRHLRQLQDPVHGSPQPNVHVCVYACLSVCECVCPLHKEAWVLYHPHLLAPSTFVNTHRFARCRVCNCTRANQRGGARLASLLRRLMQVGLGPRKLAKVLSCLSVSVLSVLSVCVCLVCMCVSRSLSLF